MENPVGREPAVLLVALVAPLLQLISTFILPLTTEQQGLLNGAIAALFGIIAAVKISAEKALPLLAGFVQAVLSVALAFGVEIPADAQTAIMALIGAVVGFYTRTQVFAPTPAQRAPMVRA